MRRMFKLVVAVVAVVVAAAVILKVAVYWNALHEEHRAERVLAAVVKLEPGVTTDAEIDRDVLPLARQFGAHCGSPMEAAAAHAGFLIFRTGEFFRMSTHLNWSGGWS